LVLAARTFLTVHAATVAWLLPLLALAAALHGWNMHHSPGPNDDEGTYVSQAWSVQEHGELSHYTYWYDHPPLGWLLLAAWNELLLVLPRGASLWYAGRDAMLVVHLASCALLYVLGRRLGLARWASSLAVLLFTISPLGMAWQRLTLLDNIGTPFVIAAWVLALSPRRRLLAYAGSGLALACAVLVKETNALFLPAIAAQLWFAGRGPNRRFGITLFAGVFVGVSGVYPLYAAVKNELFPGPGHVSLLWALKWQLFLRGGSGSPLDPTSGSHLAIADWLSRDGVLLVGALLVVPLVAWRTRRALPLVATIVLLAVMPLRGGYLPAPYPINLIWPCALLLAVGAHAALAPGLRTRGRHRASRDGHPPFDQALHRRARRRRPALLQVVTALAGCAVLVPVVLHDLAADRVYLTADDDRNYRQAESWLQQHVTHDDVLLVDNTVWIDLVQRGYARENVIWFYKFDLDPAVQEQHPGGWQAIDYVVESSIVGATDGDLPETRSTIEHGRVVAEFGDIHIYRVDHSAPTGP
jgi:hypothetical protein